MSPILSMFLFFLGLFPGGVSTASIPVGGVSRPVYGVDFNFLFQINNMHGTWKHIWTVDLNLLNRPLPDSPRMQCMDNSTPLCDTMVHFLEDTRTMFWNLTSLFSEFNSWSHDPRILETLNRGTQRMKRSLFPFIGDIEKALFGVATESDVGALKQSIKDFTDLGSEFKDQITNLGDNLASLSKITQDQVANTKKGFEQVRSTFENLTQNINNRIKDINQKLEHQTMEWSALESSFLQIWPVMEGSFQMLIKTLMVVDADMQLLEAIQQILMGYIPITMIPPRQLSEGLRVAEEGIKAVFPTASLSYPSSHLGYYYTHQIVTPLIEQTRVALIVDIPVDLGQQVLNVYAVRTFPVPLLPYNPYIHAVDPSSKASRAQSELAIRDDYFLITQDGAAYSTSRYSDLSLCKGETIKACPKQFPLYPITSASCLQQLWLDAPFEKILDICPFELSHVQHASQILPYIQVRSISAGRWYVNSPLDDKWTISCPSRPPEVRNPCTSCVIQVDCGCGVKSKYFEIPTRLSACDSVFSPLSKNYTINPFSYLAKDQPWVVNLTGTTVINHPPEPVPNIVLPDGDNWDDVMESMDKRTYDLNRLYMKQMNETKMFRSEAEALLEKIRQQDSILSAISGWPSWIVGVGLGLSFLNTFGLVLICYCLISRGVHGVPILKATRYHAEPPLTSSADGAIISLEAFILAICVINMALLIMLAWPILSQWFRTNRYMRVFNITIPRVRAAGYVHRSNGTIIVFEGTGIFRSPAAQRPEMFQIKLACLRGGWTVNTLRAPPTSAEVTMSEGVYTLHFNCPLYIISGAGEEKAIPEMPVGVSQLHRKLRVNEEFPLVEMVNGRISVMRT